MRGSGAYFDGRSARRRAVAVELTSLELRILELPDEHELDSWSLRELRPVDQGHRDGPYRIRAASSDALLILDDQSMVAEIAARAPARWTGGPSGAALYLRWAGLLVVSVAVLLAMLWFVLPRFAEHVARVVPPDWEESLGERMVVPVVRHLARLEGTESPELCAGPRGREVLEELTLRVVPPELPYHVQIRIVNLEVVNAFALPGGQILLSEGLLRFAESPDEVVGVIAHELGHAFHRHATVAMVRALSLGFLFGVMLGDLGTGAIGTAGEAVIGLSFSREAESEADASAVDLLGRAGLSTRGLVEFFERMERDIGEMPKGLALLSTHPHSESRIQRFRRAPAAVRPTLDDDEWRALQQICSRRNPLTQ